MTAPIGRILFVSQPFGNLHGSRPPYDPPPMDARTFLGLQPTHNPFRWHLSVTPGLTTGGGFLFGGCGSGRRHLGPRGDERAALRVGDGAVPLVRPPWRGHRRRRDVAAEGHQISQAPGRRSRRQPEILTVNGAFGLRPLDAAGRVGANARGGAAARAARPPHGCASTAPCTSASTCAWPALGRGTTSTGRPATAARWRGPGSPRCSRASTPPPWPCWATSCPSASARRSGSVGGGNSLDNTLRVGAARADRVGPARHPRSRRGSRLRPRRWCTCSPRTARCSPRPARADRAILEPRPPKEARAHDHHRFAPGITCRSRARCTPSASGYIELADLGYTDVWSAESDGADAFTPLALAAAWEPRLRLGTAIIPAFTRGAGVLAQSVAALADAAPGRFAFGIGTSANVIVERWNGVPFVEPYKRVRDMVRFLHDAFSGEKVTDATTRSRCKGFRLGVRPEIRRRSWWPRCARACCGSPAARPTAPSSTGCRPTTWPRWRRSSHAAGGADEGDRVPHLRVPVRGHRRGARGRAKFAIAAYLNVPVYAAFHEWLGRGDELGRCGRPGRPATARRPLAAIPDSVVDELIVHGSPDACRDQHPGATSTTASPRRRWRSCRWHRSTTSRPSATWPLVRAERWRLRPPVPGGAIRRPRLLGEGAGHEPGRGRREHEPHRPCRHGACARRAGARLPRWALGAARAARRTGRCSYPYSTPGVSQSSRGERVSGVRSPAGRAGTARSR